MRARAHRVRCRCVRLLRCGGAAIAASHVGKDFGSREHVRTVIADVSVRIEPGEIFGLLGQNGAGKTTLLKMFATLIQPSRGTIAIDGYDTVRHPKAVRARIGVALAEDRAFYFRLTGRQNLEFFAALAGLRGTAALRRIDELSAAFDLRDQLDRRYYELSTGTRNRLGLVRALLNDPRLVLLDEPTRAVDPVRATAIRAALRREVAGARGATIVVATNSLEEAWALCDRVATLEGGRLVAAAPPADVRAEAAV